ncbi:hypothetical protein KP509_09G018800 [Ceratopteris richardii]|uniref:NAD-dependent epimerase/dehydratase domain-containing protein n=1 Tax=Ceratopteris richardii TaxID=49495 RepID=A0A8T2U5U0_CERRI|nr:hypothetical protein KP509_09G018800 [Ceratopteris richardii]
MRTQAFAIPKCQALISSCYLDDPKNDHLMQLEGAATRLKLVKADLMDPQSILSAIEDCDGVFHLATPMTNDPIKVLDPAIRGTLNVLDAAAQVGVRRVVITSSIGTVCMDPHRDPTVVVDESCWSDVEYCKETKNWYCYGKTVAEQAAWDYAREKNLDLVVLIPSLVLGPLLQPTMNASTNHILKYLTGSAKTYVDMVQAYVDVRDVAKACILLYEEPNARGRYLCAESVAHRGDICSLLTELFPQYPVPKMCSNQKGPSVQPYQISNKKLSSMGFAFTPLRKSLHDTVLNLQERNDI